MHQRTDCGGDVDMLRALLEQITRERADMNASARIEGREDIEDA